MATACSDTQYQTAAPTLTSNRVCAALTDCAAGQFVMTAATATTNRVCAPCAAGTFSTATNVASCTMATACTATQYQTAAPTLTSNRVCAALTDCAVGQFVMTVATATTNRVCAPCAAGTFTSGINQTACIAPLCSPTARGSVAPTSAFTTDTCAAGEVATALAVQSDGRGYATALRLGCGTVTGTTVGAVRWPGGAPGGSFTVYQCPSGAMGQVVSSLTTAIGEIVDRVGIECRVPNWSSDAPATVFGTAATGGNVRSCPAGNGLSSLARATVNYFGGTVVAQINTTCVGSAATTTLTRVAGADAPGTSFSAACPAGQVAVGIGVGTEGRGFVRSFNVQCAALNATRTGYLAATTVGTLTGTANTATCPAGQQLVGVNVANGDVIDRLGAICRPIDWSSTSATTNLGPWSAGATTPSACPPGHVVTGLSGRTVNYFGGTTASAVIATCAPLACP